MNVNYKSGAQELVDWASVEDAAAKLGDPKVKSVSLHNPGDIIEMRDGRSYLVARDGSWRRLPIGGRE